MSASGQHMMHAAAIDRFGGEITPHMVPMPQPGPEEILIHVEAAGVGVWDPFEREGGFAKMMGQNPRFPYVLGSEGAGTIEEVGEAVREFKKGDRVYAVALANPKGGFYAEYAAVDAHHASPIPRKMSIDQAGVMPVDAMTALIGLDDTLHLKKGQTILIFGASGGIGHMAVQLALRMGARVLAVASGPDGVKMVQQLGADMVVDGHKDDVLAAAKNFTPEGLDCILFTAGGDAAQKAMQALRAGGRAAYPNGVENAPRARSGTKIHGYDGMPKADTIEKLNRMIEKAPFEVFVAKTFKLDEAAEAHKALDQHFVGKIALHPTV